MAARDEILNRLRDVLSRPTLRFPPAAPTPLTADTRMAVTAAEGDGRALAQRFGAELEALHGSFEIMDTATEARLAAVNRLLTWIEEEKAARKGPPLETGQEASVLGWHPDRLPVPGLQPALEDLGLRLVAPAQLTTVAEREAVRHIRYGITGVEAVFASTGSMLVLADEGASRAASLLPFRHIALIPFSRLYPTMEAWLAAQRAAGALPDLLRGRANWTLITGPSKSADIESNLTLGVHGPKFVHAILFEHGSSYEQT
jgi:L-lactate dehydrogenase complex protein LldG